MIITPYSGTLSEAFVKKLDSTGKIVLFTSLSGGGSDTANALAVDAVGNIYVAGSTSSANLPLHNALQSTARPGFLTKYSPDGSQLIFSSYFPAPISALAVDASGNVYVCGTTNSRTFPVTAGLPASSLIPTPPMIHAGASLGWPIGNLIGNRPQLTTCPTLRHAAYFEATARMPP